MKKVLILPLLILINTANIFAQKLIPFQIQSQKQIDYNAKWGYMTEDRKVVLSPVFYMYTPPLITEQYIIYGNKIMEIKTGKIVWDSVEAKGVSEIRGNIVSIKMPLRGAVDYQPYSFKNIKTKKLLTIEGRFANEAGFVVTESSAQEGVVDENGKIIVAVKQYQKVKSNGSLFFVSDNMFTYYDVFNKKGEQLNKENYIEVDISGSGSEGKKQLSLAQRKLKDAKAVYELIFLNPLGKAVGQPLFYTSKEGRSPFILTYFGSAISKKEYDLFTDKLCSEKNKLKKIIVVNGEGKIIINTDDYTEVNEIGDGLFSATASDAKRNMVINNKGEVFINTTEYKNFKIAGENLFTAIGNDGKKYLLNNKVEIVGNVGIMQRDQVYRNSLTNFMIHKKDIRKLFFYNYDVAEGKSKAAEFVQMEPGIEIDFVDTAFGKYYLARIADKKKNQYASYIYDNNGNLVLKSEDGIWMYKVGFLIKYIENSKREKLYLGYYDADLKPYSVIE